MSESPTLGSAGLPVLTCDACRDFSRRSIGVVSTSILLVGWLCNAVR